ncbi:MAG: MarR family winged helix-turn-helix transcriptional regulator [Clostridiales bacterium]|nr:MarR family winged helix-turn-helix transcriptional regulator [Clostridiales bacterium]
MLSNLIGRVVDNSPTRLQIEDATGNNTWIIGFIAQRSGEDVFQRDIEKQFGVTRSTASKVVSLMEKKGLIVRQSIPYDARLKKLVLTDRSWEILNCMEAEFRLVEDTLEKGFTEEELAQFFDYIHRMQNNINHISYIKEEGGE